MADHLGREGYRQLFIQVGHERARALLDNLQVLALTRPEAVHELEAFLQRQLGVTPAREERDEDTVLRT